MNREEKSVHNYKAYAATQKNAVTNKLGTDQGWPWLFALSSALSAATMLHPKLWNNDVKRGAEVPEFILFSKLFDSSRRRALIL